MHREFNFDPRKIVNKIIQALNNPMNDEYYIEHLVGSNAIYFKTRRWKIKNYHKKQTIY